jgi:hypothetical protein
LSYSSYATTEEKWAYEKSKTFAMINCMFEQACCMFERYHFCNAKSLTVGKDDENGSQNFEPQSVDFF